MITQTQIAMLKQEPDEGYDWLYREDTQNGDVTRIYSKSVWLGINDREWNQCTQAEYEDWQVTHPNPTEVRSTEQQVVELIRQRYTANQEYAILRRRDTEPAAFEEYYAYVEECIATIKGAQDNS